MAAAVLELAKLFKEGLLTRDEYETLKAAELSKLAQPSRTAEHSKSPEVEGPQMRPIPPNDGAAPPNCSKRRRHIEVAPRQLPAPARCGTLKFLVDNVRLSEYIFESLEAVAPIFLRKDFRERAEEARDAIRDYPQKLLHCSLAAETQGTWLNRVLGISNSRRALRQALGLQCAHHLLDKDLPKRPLNKKMRQEIPLAYHGPLDFANFLAFRERHRSRETADLLAVMRADTSLPAMKRQLELNSWVEFTEFTRNGRRSEGVLVNWTSKRSRTGPPALHADIISLSMGASVLNAAYDDSYITHRSFCLEDIEVCKVLELPEARRPVRAPFSLPFDTVPLRRRHDTKVAFDNHCMQNDQAFFKKFEVELYGGCGIELRRARRPA